MGEIADMMLEGLLDEETGEYIGDQNKSRYGTESPGFPVSYNREDRENETTVSQFACDICGKKLKSRIGILQHKRDKHNKKWR